MPPAAATITLHSLAYWRSRRRLTQEQLANRIGMRRNAIWWIESGHPTRVRTAHLLAKALEITTAELQAQAPEAS